MDGLQGGAGEFELAAGLQADVGAAAVQADQGLALADLLPAEALHPLQQGEDAVGAVIGDGVVRAQAEWELLVLRADAELRGRLAAVREIGGHGLESQRRIVHDGLPHAFSQPLRGGPSPDCAFCSGKSDGRQGWARQGEAINASRRSPPARA